MDRAAVFSIYGKFLRIFRELKSVRFFTFGARLKIRCSTAIRELMTPESAAQKVRNVRAEWKLEKRNKI